MNPPDWLKDLLPRRHPLLLRLLREEILPRRTQYLLAAAAMACGAGATTFSAWLMKDVINEIFVARNSAMLWFISALVAAIFVFKGAAEYGYRILLGKAGNAITASLRRRYYNKLLEQELRFFVNASSSQFVAQLIRHIDSVRNAAELLVSAAARDLVTVVGLSAVMLSQQPALLAVVLPVALSVILFVGALSNRLGDVVREEHQADVKLIAAVQETARGIRSVKAFNLAPLLNRRFGDFTRASEGRANRINRIQSLIAPLTEALGGLAVAGVILYSGWQAIESGTPPGEFMAFITALLLAYEPAKRLSHLKLQLEQQLVLVENFYGFLDRQPLIADIPDALELPVGEPLRIHFRDVDFRYWENTPLVLEALNFALEPGKITALCGPSGCGKSTLVDLLFRFHDPWAGNITVAGLPLRRLSTRSLSRLCAHVGQDVFLFDDSIRENILIGREDGNADQLQQVVDAMRLRELAQDLPAGLDTEVGEQGTRLSGGQKQRIAIARALLKQAPVLVLDEATSALDPVTERAILQNIRRLQPDSSLLIVSHRIAPLAIADQVLLLDRGRLVEQGSYDELARPGSRFHQLFRDQLQASPEQGPGT